MYHLGSIRKKARAVKYIVELTSEAERGLNRLDRTAERRIRERLKKLAIDPYVPGCQSL